MFILFFLIGVIIITLGIWLDEDDFSGFGIIIVAIALLGILSILVVLFVGAHLMIRSQCMSKKIQQSSRVLMFL